MITTIFITTIVYVFLIILCLLCLAKHIKKNREFENYLREQFKITPKNKYEIK